jgi:hypothetical protein
MIAFRFRGNRAQWDVAVQYGNATGGRSPALSMKRPTALRMQVGLSGSQFFDQHLDPIDRELIRDRRRYSFAMLNFFIELDALVAHGQFPPLKGTIHETEFCSRPGARK